MMKLKRGLCICVCVLLLLACTTNVFAQEVQIPVDDVDVKQEGENPLPSVYLDGEHQGVPEGEQQGVPDGEQQEVPEGASPTQSEEISPSGDQIADAVSEAASIIPSMAEGGNITPNQSVTFSCADPNYEVRYTTDGTEPTSASTLGSNAVDISAAPFTQIKAALFQSSIKVEGSEREFCYSSRNNYVTLIQLQQHINAENDGVSTGWFVRKYAEQPISDSSSITLPDYYEYVAPTQETTKKYNLITYNSLDLQGIQNPAFSFWVYHEMASAGEAQPEIYLEIAEVRPNGSFGTVRKVGPYISSKQTTSGWLEYFIDLSDYKDKGIFWRIGVNGTHNVIMDNLKIVDMQLAAVTNTMSAQVPYDDTQIILSAVSGATVYYNENENCFMGNGIDTMLGVGQVFFPTLKNANKELYCYAEQLGAKSAVSLYQLPVATTKPVEVHFSGDASRYIPGDSVTLTTEQKDSGNTAKIYYSYDAQPVINADGTAGLNTWSYSGPFLLEKPINKLYAVAYVENMELNVSEFSVNYDKLKDVTASVPTGTVVTQGTQIILTASEGCSIKYTLDGSIPSDTNGMTYTQPIVINEKTMINACAIKQGYANGKTTSFHYVLNKEGDVYEPNNTLDYATSLGFPFSLEANLQPQNDIDYYSFDVPAETHLEVRLEFPADTKNASLQLFDASGVLVETAFGENVKIISKLVNTGKYFVMVKGSALEQSYKLNVTKRAAEGLDFSENNLLTTMLHSQSPISWDMKMNGGGLFHMANAYFSGWRGPLYEEDDPYDGSLNVLTTDPNTGESIVDETKVLYKQMQPKFHFQKGLTLPTFTEDINLKHIKNAIYTYGAVHGNYLNSFTCWNENRTYHYLPAEADPGDSGFHEITFVGWDDTIPKEKFTVNIGGTEYTPPGDGGIIIKNSWGESVGESGFAYISYYSNRLGSNNPSIYILDELPGNYNTIYEHDPVGRTSSMTIDKNVAFQKNVFMPKNDEKLRAVSFYTTDPNQVYDVYIKVGDESQEHIARGSNVYPGYITLRLDNVIAIPKNTKFEICVRLENTSDAKLVIPLELAIAGFTSKASASPGQSFYSSDGITWDDIAVAYGANFCIKAFTYNTASSEMNAVTTSQEDTIHKLYTIEEINAIPEIADIEITHSQPVFSALEEYPVGSVGIKTEGDDFNMEELQVTLPDRFDLRDTGAVTSVKNQDNIGSCWTFASMGSAESVFMRNNNTAFAHPTNVVLNKTNEQVILSTAQRTANVSATATIMPSEVGTDRILWSYSGDLNSIDIKTVASRSGEEKVLFTAKATGTVTVTAQSASDVTRMATMTVKITDNTLIPGGEGKEIVTLHVGEDGSYDEEVLKSLLSNLKPNQALLIRTVNGTVIPASVFEQIQGQDKTIIFQVVNKEGNPILNMCFNGKDITKPLPLNLAFSNTPSANAQGAWKASDPTLFLNFGHNGELPGKAIVSVVSTPPFTTGENLFLYYYNNAKNTYDYMEQSVFVNAQGYGAITLTHCSEYALTNKKQISGGGTEKEEEQPTNKVTAPSTGDGKDVTVWIIVAIMGVCALLTVSAMKIKKEKNHKQNM